MKEFLKIHPSDNVLVALVDLKQGAGLISDENELVLKDDVQRGHKISLVQIESGSNIIKYGESIGHALQTITPGEHVHTHNLKTNLSGELCYNYEPIEVNLDQTLSDKTFKGYKRFDGLVGIRNELWIVPTVGCVNGIADQIITEYKLQYDTDDLDSLTVFKHNYGCSQLGDDHENTKTILADIVKHPNAGGVLVLGLGCENNQPDEFEKFLKNYDKKRIRFMVTQKVEDEIESGVEIIHELHQQIKRDVRQECPISELKIGLKCGASDGLSGITANPLLGVFSDYIVQNGGTTVLTEVPEMFGAETLLMNRAINEEVFDEIVSMINRFKQYFIKHNQPIYENPSPGNKSGGISTLEDKSLGCIQKGGKSIITDVIDYGERISKNGLNLLYGPGNDLVSATALGSSGCQMVLFTTGKGTPFGSFVPTMKISTNSEIYNKKPRWIDFNAGALVENKTMEGIFEEFLDYLIDVANGVAVNNEKNNIREIAIFKSGVTL